MYAKRGLGIAAISYDSRGILHDFADRVGIHFPLLADPGSRVIRAFGVLNTNIPTDNFRYGVPFPGTYIVDEHGVVTAKYFEHDLRERTTARTILVERYGEGGGRRLSAQTPHLSLTAYSSEDNARRGHVVAFVLEVELGPKMHIYAPGVEHYLASSFTIADQPAFRAHGARFPKPEILDLAAIKERVPVYTGRVRIVQDVTISPDFHGDTLTIPATFEYQACDDHVCYLPVKVPLRFTLHLTEHDDTRVPEAARRKPGR